MYKFNFLRKSGYENKNQEKNILSILQDTEFLKSYKYNMEWQQCYTVRNGKWFEDVLREKCEPLRHKEQFEERWKIKEQIIKAGEKALSAVLKWASEWNEENDQEPWGRVQKHLHFFTIISTFIEQVDFLFVSIYGCNPPSLC